MGKSLNFSLSGDEYVSDALTPDGDKVTVNVLSSDAERESVIVAEHSINGEYWQLCGSQSFYDGVELTVSGLRQGVQKVRFRLTTKPGKAEWV